MNFYQKRLEKFIDPDKDEKKGAQITINRRLKHQALQQANKK